MKLKVLKEYDMNVGYEAYIVDFVRREGETLAIIVYEDGSISANNIENIIVDFENIK